MRTEPAVTRSRIRPGHLDSPHSTPLRRRSGSRFSTASVMANRDSGDDDSFPARPSSLPRGSPMNLVTSSLGGKGDGMPFLPPPTSAAWSHQHARSGFEVVYLRAVEGGGHLLTGATTAVEDGQPWIVDYEIRIDIGWRTRSAR